MNRKILIIGVGGIGSFLVSTLDKVGIYNISVADPDIVESKNLTYQNFSKGHVGQNKASVIMDSYDSVTSFSKYPILTAKQMQGYDLVICCVDNLSVRQVAIAGLGAQWIQRYMNDEKVREYMVVNV